MFMVMFVSILKPFSTKQLNHLEMFNETMIFYLMLFSSMFSDITADYSFKYKIGWV